MGQHFVIVQQCFINMNQLIQCYSSSEDFITDCGLVTSCAIMNMININLGSGLMPIWHQVITWTSADENKMWDIFTEIYPWGFIHSGINFSKYIPHFSHLHKVGHIFWVLVTELPQNIGGQMHQFTNSQKIEIYSYKLPQCPHWTIHILVPYYGLLKYHMCTYNMDNVFHVCNWPKFIALGFSHVTPHTLQYHFIEPIWSAQFFNKGQKGHMGMQVNFS